jgi:hypothetical protein
MSIDRVIESFFSFREGKSYRCKYHNGVHYVDRVVINKDLVARYMLHGHEIAVLNRYGGNFYWLVLSNCGYSTRITIDTLNAILGYLKDKLGVDHGVSFHLKYGRLGRPIATYIRFGENTYLTGRVGLFFRPGVARPVVVVLDTSTKIYFFKDHPELRSLYRLYRRFVKLYDEVLELYNKYKDYKGGVDPDTYKAVKDMFKKMYGEDVDDAYDDFVRVSLTYNIATYKWGFEYYGVFARYIDDNDYATVVKNILNGEIAFAKYVADKLKRMLTIAKLVH